MRGKTVVIIGHNEMSRLSLIRAAGQLGCEVYNIVVYHGDKKPRIRPFDTLSRYATYNYYTPAQNSVLLFQLLQSLAAKMRQAAVIIPCSDFAAATIDTYRNELSASYIIPGTNTSGDVSHLMDKVYQKQIADSLQLQNAKSWTVSIAKDGQYQLPTDIIYPCFPKASLSVSGGKLGMTRCSNENELRAAILDIISAGSTQVLVEEFLEIEKEYACIGYSDGEKVIIPGVLYLRQLAHGIHKGVAVAGELLPASNFTAILNQFKEFVKATHFVGLFDIDFFYSNNTYYFGEMNMRVGASVDAYIKAGANLLIPVLQNDADTPAMPTIALPTPFVNNRMVQLDWIDDFTGNHEMLRLMTNKNGFIYDKKDAGPIVYYYTLYMGRMVKKFLKKMLRRK